MKWILASERLPEKSGDFYIKKNHERYLTTYDIGIGFGIYGNIEWLDESESPVPNKVDAAVELLQKQIDRLEVHDEMLLNTICQDLKKAVKILKQQ